VSERTEIDARLHRMAAAELRPSAVICGKPMQPAPPRLIAAERRMRLRERFKANAAELLATDPACNGRVTTATLEMLAEHALALAESAIRGDRRGRT
jgi:hypothetical protein